MVKLFHWLAVLLWVLSAVALVLAWWAVYSRGLILGFEPLAWYWNALVFGVLSLGAHNCTEGKCMPMSGGSM